MIAKTHDMNFITDYTKTHKFQQWDQQTYILKKIDFLIRQEFVW